jgi:tetratricopeptide (TPR) repeat protein
MGKKVQLQESPSTVGLEKKTSIIEYIPILILISYSFVVYLNALFGDFVYDDKDQIVDNPWIRDIRNIPVIFSRSVWDFRPGVVISNYFRPLMHIVYMFNYHIFGLSPWGFHLVNIVLHCGVSVLVFVIIRRLLTEHKVTASPWYLSPPFIAAMLFASHPIHTEAVTWIAGLPDVAFTFFYLLSFYLYIQFRDGVKRSYFFSIFSFAIATLFKEPALTFPIMLVAYDYLFNKPDKTIIRGMKIYIPYIIISGGYLLIRDHALGAFSPAENYPDLSTYQLIINVFPLFRKYVTSLLWPFNLNVWHTFHPISSLTEAEGMISLVVTVIFSVAVVAAYRKNRVALLGLSLFVIPLLPVFYINGIGGKPFAERYLYLPSAGFAVLLAVFWSWVRGKFPHTGRKIMTTIFVVIVGLYSFGTVDRNNIWKNELTLWSDTVRKSPDSTTAHYGLAAVYRSQAKLDRAVQEYQTALRLKPDDANAHANLGALYQSQGQIDKAIQEYQTASRLKPDDANAHANLGALYQSQGQTDRAIKECQIALRLNPDDTDAHYNLGLAYASQGKLDEAIQEYRTVLWQNPRDTDTHYNLGLAYASQGKLDKAIQEYQTVLRLNPTDYGARQHLNDIVSRRH